MKALKQKTSVVTYEKLTGIYHVIKEHGDEINANKIIDLYKKKQNDEFTVSFTGHFSAGKSSMINSLIGSDLLPKSPIPTSANIVKLTSGEGVARVFFRSENPIEYEEPYDLEIIKEFARDKDAIKKIEISTSQPIIPENCSIIDTPGIDAADDTDRIITESSLHLVDVLFYVMDYNHVQSELNLKFLKKIQAMKIPFYIIINQIDKHNDNELSFQAFDHSVKQTFVQWELSPEAIYYSSLIKEDAPFNQFIEIKHKLTHLFHEERIQRFDSSVQNIIDSHKQFLQGKYEEEVANLPLSDEVDKDLLEKVNETKQLISTLQQKPEDFKYDFMNSIDQTLKNAYLMPATVRDKALLFLESQQKDFKMGFFGAKKKTEDEKFRRMDDFLGSLKDSIQANIEWKLREKLIELLQLYSNSNQEMVSSVQQLSIAFDKKDILSVIKKGAQVNGDAVLNYTNELANLIKGKYRMSARKILDATLEVLLIDCDDKITHHNEILNKYKEQVQVLEEYQSLENRYRNQVKRIKEQLHTPEFSHDTEKIIQMKLKKAVFKKGETISKYYAEKKNSIDEEYVIKDREKETTPTVNRIVRAIQKTIQIVEDLPVFESMITELTSRMDRLQNRQLTIALFGAFSAGKSSFANALIGEGVLPSSPNPTTAVINRITPVTEENEHGTVVIHMKDHETLRQDLGNILKHFKLPVLQDIGNLVEWIKEHNIHNNDELAHMYQNYLQAIIKGYDDHKELIGKSTTMHIEEFGSYVTEESKACFVESIDLYYDCSITKRGITLVDTPGADSVNARHTNVAFDYIKNADAILYVTYYNHAITKADKDFVMQLGRVKESFELDKMFFIINASDLAQDETELSLVVNYVQEQLNKLGIRNPRLYPISSKQSLEEKEAGKPINNQLIQFEEDFYSFLENELSQLTVKMAVHELNRTRQQLVHFKQKASLNEQEKLNYKYELQVKKERFVNAVDKSNGMIYNDRLSQKISKQLHYVIERFSIRFHDMFKDNFNPTTVTESGKNGISQLERNTVDLLDYAGYELLQEARAVSLRVEAFINEQYRELMDIYTQKLREIDNDFSLPALKTIILDTPEYDQPLQDVQPILFKKAFSLFKGTKSFFVQNEKEKVKDTMYQILLPVIQNYMGQLEKMMIATYLKQWENLLAKNVQHIHQEIFQYVTNSLAALDDTIDINLLVNKEKDLVELLESIK